MAIVSIVIPGSITIPTVHKRCRTCIYRCSCRKPLSILSLTIRGFDAFKARRPALSSQMPTELDSAGSGLWAKAHKASCGSSDSIVATTAGQKKTLHPEKPWSPSGLKPFRPKALKLQSLNTRKTRNAQKPQTQRAQARSPKPLNPNP